MNIKIKNEEQSKLSSELLEKVINQDTLEKKANLNSKEIKLANKNSTATAPT